MATKKRNSHFVKKTAVYTYKYTSLDANGVANSTVAAHPSTIKLPAGCIIDKCYVNVTEAFTSATNAATVGIGLKTVTAGSEDLIVAIAVSGAPWSTTGIKGSLVNAPNLGADTAHDSALEVIALDAALKLLLTGESTLTVNNTSGGNEVLTAGEATIYLDYWLP